MKRNTLIITTALTAAGFLLAYKSLSSDQTEAVTQQQPLQETAGNAEPQAKETNVLEGTLRGGETVHIPVAGKAAEKAEVVTPEQQAGSSPETTTTEEQGQIEEQLQGNLLKDEKVLKEAEINSINCNEKGCTIDASAKKEDDSHFQMAFVEFLRKHPEFGNKIDIKPSPDNPRNVAFVYYKD